MGTPIDYVTVVIALWAVATVSFAGILALALAYEFTLKQKQKEIARIGVWLKALKLYYSGYALNQATGRVFLLPRDRYHYMSLFLVRHKDEFNKATQLMRKYLGKEEEGKEITDAEALNLQTEFRRAIGTATE
jgi:hypothetical protein